MIMLMKSARKRDVSVRGVKRRADGNCTRASIGNSVCPLGRKIGGLATGRANVLFMVCGAGVRGPSTRPVGVRVPLNKNGMYKFFSLGRRRAGRGCGRLVSGTSCGCFYIVNGTVVLCFRRGRLGTTIPCSVLSSVRL